MPDAPFSRRPSPILLVIPVILTIAGIALSVMLYLNLYKKDEGALAQEEAASAQLARIRQQHDELLQREGALRGVLGYAGEDYQAWLEAKLRVGSHVDFKLAAEARESERRTLDGNVTALNSQIQQVSDQITSVQEAKKRLIETKRVEIDQKLKDGATADQRYTPSTSVLLKRINESGTVLIEKRDERDRAKRVQKETKEKQDRTLIALQWQLERLEDTLSGQRGLVQHVDGHVVRVGLGSDRVIVDLGRRHRLRPGLRFKVVEKGQVARDPRRPSGPLLVPPTAAHKGEIEILRVYDDQSSAVILNVDIGKPFLSGDAIYNPGYDPKYKTRFVLVGRLDLTGNSRHDGDLVERLIADIGGVIEDEVDVRTDFLLVGADWPTDDPTSAKRYYRDQEQIKAAEGLDVSFLSVRRFLEYAGVRIGLDGVPQPAGAGL